MRAAFEVAAKGRGGWTAGGSRGHIPGHGRTVPRRRRGPHRPGRSAAGGGRPEEAEVIYRATAEQFPDNVIAHTSLAEALRAAGQLDEAEATYRAAAERFPDNAVARTGLAGVLRAAGRLDEAEAMYRAAAEQFPDNAMARTGLAGLLRAAGRLDEAEAIYLAAAQQFPTMPWPAPAWQDCCGRPDGWTKPRSYTGPRPSSSPTM